MRATPGPCVPGATDVDRADRGSGMRYQIRIQGHLDGAWAAWFDGLAITHEAGGTTLLAGELADQAALHGALAKVRDLGLSLLAVTAAVEQDTVERAPP